MPEMSSDILNNQLTWKLIIIKQYVIAQLAISIKFMSFVFLHFI